MKKLHLMLLVTFLSFSFGVINASDSLKSIQTNLQTECCTTSASMSYCEEVSSTTCSINKTKEDDIDLSDEKKIYHHSIATFFGVQLFNHSKNFVETMAVNYIATKSGIMCHVGWYGDAYIITFLHGFDEGKQIVFLNGKIFELTYPAERTFGGIIHKYSWGTIYTHYHCQEIKFN